MIIGWNGKDSSLGMWFMRIRENYKTLYYRARNMELKEEDMVNETPISKDKLIQILSNLIHEITQKDEKQLRLKDGKIKFREYPRLLPGSGRLRAIDVTIEA